MKFELKPYNRDFSKEDLLSDIKKVAKALGKDTLTQEDYNKHGQFSSSSCVRRFGGLLKALEKAGLKKHAITTFQKKNGSIILNMFGRVSEDNPILVTWSNLYQNIPMPDININLGAGEKH